MLYSVQQNLMQLTPLSQNKPSIADLIDLYIENNPETGYIVFQVVDNSVIDGMKPIQNAKITISKALGNGYFISKVVTTNESGKTDPVALPTVRFYHSLSPEEDISYSTYNATVEANNFLTTDIFDIRVFDDITSLQTVQLLPGQGYKIHQIYQSEPQNLCNKW
nr:hypothetical protein [Sedimentibacter sp.]